MRVLVTGATGIVGTASVEALLERGHTVRLLARGAEDAARAWPERVEPFAADVGDAAALRGAAEGCEAVLHVAGILLEDPPERTYGRVNVGGTRNLLAEAERAGVRRFVYTSTLGAESGRTPYQQSKKAAGDLVRAFPGSWALVRLANVYGPGDYVISLLIKVLRASPVVPIINRGNDEFQPIWHRDAGRALALLVERDDIAGRAVELAGGDRTTMNDLVDRLSRITGRRPVRVPLPASLAIFGGRLAALLHIDLPVSDQQVTMLLEGSVVEPGDSVLGQLGIEPTALDDGLKALADATPEQLPKDGIGALQRKAFWADVVDSPCTARELRDRFRASFGDILPVDVGVEPGTGDRLDPGETLTLALPLRGNIQVRCHEVSETTVTLVTLAGHPLAGAVQFCFEPRNDGALRVEVQVWDRAANALDLVAMRTMGDHLQDRNWEQTIERLVALAGGRARDGVQRCVRQLDAARAAEVNDWLEELVKASLREERAADQPA